MICMEKLFKVDAQLAAILFICQSKFGKGAEMRLEVTNIVSPFLGFQAHTIDAPTFLNHAADGIGELNLAIFAGLSAFERWEDGRAEDVARGDGQIAGSFVWFRLLDHIGQCEDITSAILRLSNSVAKYLTGWNLLEGDDSIGLLFDEASFHAFHDITLGM